MIPPAYPSHSYRAVHSVVSATQQDVLDRACAALRHTSAPGTMVDLRHFGTPAELWATFPFEANATAVLDIRRLRRAATPEPSPVPRSTLAGFVAAWDHVVLLCSPDELGDVETVVRSTLAARVHLLPRDLEDERWYVAALHALWSRSIDLRRAPTDGLPADMYEHVGRLTTGMQRWVLHALASPAEWNAQQLADACGVSPRTLERRFAEVGLASPGRLLQLVRLRARRRPTPAAAPVSP